MTLDAQAALWRARINEETWEAWLCDVPLTWLEVKQ